MIPQPGGDWRWFPYRLGTQTALADSTSAHIQQSAPVLGFVATVVWKGSGLLTPWSLQNDADTRAGHAAQGACVALPSSAISVVAFLIAVGVAGGIRLQPR